MLHPMARKPRIHEPGAVYHVILRGNHQEPIFFDDTDRRALYSLLADGIAKHDHQIHAFCLMDNHVHLALQVHDIPLSKIIQNMAFRFARRMNSVLQRSGHLFQGRYKAVLVDSDRYLLELVRYIHSNPLRAGWRKLLTEYPWSSHRAYLHLDSLPWLSTDFILGILSDKPRTADARYRRYMDEDQSPEVQELLRRGGEGDRRVAGRPIEGKARGRRTSYASVTPPAIEAILKAVENATGMRRDQLGAAGKDRRCALGRALAAWLVRREGGRTLAELSNVFHRDLSTLSSAATRLQARMETDRSVSDFVEEAHRRIQVNQ